MRALLLAAGLGTRLRPITNSIPKCMVQIHGKPLLGYWLDLLLNDGVEKILINTHYLSDSVRAFVTNSEWAESITLVHESTLLGTGGTVLKNRDFSSGQSLMVAHADNLTLFKPSNFIAAHEARQKGVCITMMTFDADEPQNCGIVVLDSRGIVRSFHEKVSNPPGSLANGAVYIFEQEVIDFISSLDKKVCDISIDVLPSFIGRIQTYHNNNYHRDIGTPKALALAEIEYKII